MISSQVIIAVTVAYLALLFYFAYRGDRHDSGLISRYQPLIYTLSLTVYCTSWTFFGAVGNASQAGLAFFSIYLGPILGATTIMYFENIFSAFNHRFYDLRGCRTEWVKCVKLPPLGHLPAMEAGVSPCCRPIGDAQDATVLGAES